MIREPARLHASTIVLTGITTLAALVFALLGAWRLPDPTTRLQGAILLAAGVVLANYSFWRVEKEWPRPDPAPAIEPGVGARSPRPYVRIAGIILLALGLGLTIWALLDIWGKAFVWNQTGRWLLGLILMLAGLYLVGRRTEDGDQRSEIGGQRLVLSGAEGSEGGDQIPNNQSPITPPSLRPSLSASLPPAPPLPFYGPLPSGYKLRALGLDEDPPEVRDQRLEIGSRGDANPQSPISTLQSPLPRWLEITLVLAILLAAIFFRLYKIQSMPPGIFIDETNTALDALRIMEGRPDSLYGTGWFETPNAFAYLQLAVIKLLGTTVAAIKVQSILPGILTVLALWLLARELFGPLPAIFAAAFLAFNRWHFNMSRWGWNEVYPPLIQVLSVYFIVRAARRRSWGDWAMAGFVLGLGMYTYLSIRLAVLAIGAYLVYRALIERGFLRRNWQGLAIFAAIYALTFAPLAFTYYKDPFTFLNRSQQVSILNDVRSAGGDLAPLQESVKRHLLMFHVAGDTNGRHNLPGAPMLDPITGAFFVLGLGWAVWKWRDHRRVLSLIWIAFTLLGGILSQLAEAPQAYRTLAVTPAIALLCADVYDLALRGLFAPLRQRRGRGEVTSPLPQTSPLRWAIGGVAVAGLLIVAWLNYSFYFGRQANDPGVYIAFSPLETTVAREVLAKRDDHRLYLSPRLYYFAPLRFLAYEPTQPYGIKIGAWQRSPFQRLGGGLEQPSYRLADPASDLPLPDLGGDSASFLVDLHFEYVLDHFRYFYPGTTSEIVRDRNGGPLYLSISIPGNEITALQAHNRADQAAEIKGIYIPASGQYTLEAPSPARLLLDGQALEPGPHFLGKGLHAIEISDLPVDLPADAPILTWQSPSGAGPIPDAALFRLPPSGQGLLGTYYSGSDWSGPALMQRLDPMLVASWPDPEPIFGPFSTSWTGELLVPADGYYPFHLDADDGVRLTVDGQMVGESLNPDTVNAIDAGLNLAAGLHPIRIDYFQRGGGKALEFFWQPPGQPFQPVAPQYLRPAAQ
ncbi:MAG: glycosyltransferase family 39 protein [Caldilineales bacterium]|nr:glycosyltransferase family 39 protein [Caldilineales bacterium]